MRERPDQGMRVSPPLAVFLMGPTASGKTALAMELCRALPLEIISVDASQVYRGMDVGTAKPSAAERARCPHRLIDIRDPGEPYSAAQFREDALREMANIVRSGRTPLLVGGTMLYFRALERGLFLLPSADADVRRRLAQEANQLGWPALHARLQAIDPEAAAAIGTHDAQRIQRALEIHALTGRVPTQARREASTGPAPYATLKLAVSPAQRAELHGRIETRFRSMLEQGLLDEARALLGRGDLSPELPALRTVGYRQVFQYLIGEVEYSEMVQRGIYATRQLAKRQLTWLRGEPELKWFDSTQEGYEREVVALVSRRLEDRESGGRDGEIASDH